MPDPLIELGSKHEIHFKSKGLNEQLFQFNDLGEILDTYQHAKFVQRCCFVQKYCLKCVEMYGQWAQFW